MSPGAARSELYDVEVGPVTRLQIPVLSSVRERLSVDGRSKAENEKQNTPHAGKATLHHGLAPYETLSMRENVRT